MPCRRMGEWMYRPIYCYLQIKFLTLSWTLSFFRTMQCLMVGRDDLPASCIASFCKVDGPSAASKDLECVEVPSFWSSKQCLCTWANGGSCQPKCFLILPCTQSAAFLGVFQWNLVFGVEILRREFRKVVIARCWGNYTFSEDCLECHPSLCMFSCGPP
jgi:hypothetical protein